MEPLATALDLEVKGVDTSVNVPLVDMMLAVASSVIREAAGGTISQETSTISLMAPQEGRWFTLPGPVISVSEVLLDGAAVSDWKLVGGKLWRRCGWSLYCEPVEATVTLVHGLLPVPADIVNLCADLAKLGIDEASREVRPADLISTTTTIDDYTETSQYAANARSLMELPTETQEWLAQRFGGGVYVTSELK